jgi:uncharacterized protein YcbK (DUF882 family)
MLRNVYRSAVPAAVLASGLLFSALPAEADVTHVVGKGQTLEAIANRYHVTQKAIVDANKLASPKSLKPGDTLIIPGVKPKEPKKKDDAKDKKDPKAAAAATKPPAHAGETPNAIAPSPSHHGPSFEEKPKQPDIVHFVRLGEDFRIKVKDHRGKIPPPALKSFEKAMRSGAASHSVDPRLVALLGMVSNHFGGRTLEIVSGYRPFAPTQYTPHSNHNLGKAMDFRIVGVPNEVLRDFCKTLRNVGVGFYPNSTFVHLDVRDAPAYWVDYSRPGEPPKYDRPNPAADEGASDVPDAPPAAPAPEATGDAPKPTQTSVKTE